VDAVFSPALQATMIGLSHDDAETRGLLGLLDSTDRVARILGPGSAALLLTVLPRVDLFAVNAASFAASAGCLAFAHRWQPRVLLVRRVAPIPRCAGLDALRLDSGVMIATALRIACNLVWAAFTLGLPVLLVQTMHKGLGAYGLLLAAFGLGNLLGNLAVGNLDLDRHLLTVYCAAWAAVGIGFLAMGLARGLPTVAVACVWAGVFTPLANVSMDTHIARRLPSASLAPALAFQRAVVRTAGLISTGIIGLLLTLGTVFTLAAAGTWMILAATAALMVISHAKRHLGRAEPECFAPPHTHRG
jgi:predicted MFS family arabinose efflux permease